MVPVTWLPFAGPPPRSSLNTWSPCSSVHTARPTMPVSLSLKAIASPRNPTPGRDGPASTSVPLRSASEAWRLSPRDSVWTLPAAVHDPWKSCHAASPPALCAAGSPVQEHSASMAAVSTVDIAGNPKADPLCVFREPC
jgi:hypothetical protein